jgi:putative hydrolase of the HAD superfamily
LSLQRHQRVWLFDLDDTLHDASHASMRGINRAMTDYVAKYLDLSLDDASALRAQYWRRYGATLLGLIRHHGVKASHFLEETHQLPGLEAQLRTSAHDRAVLKRLRGRKYILTNAPRAYALRVLHALKLIDLFDGVITIDEMQMFGHLRPKPDARMLRHVAVQLKVPPSRCVLVEDTLQHQKAAHGIGMKGIWMRRYLHAARKSVNNGMQVGVHHCPTPSYVYARIRSLKTLLAL